MEKYEINQSTVRWLKKRFKNLFDPDIIEKASKIAQNYMEENKEKIKKEEKLKQKHFEEAIDKEFLYLKLFGTDEE